RLDLRSRPAAHRADRHRSSGSGRGQRQISRTLCRGSGAPDPDRRDQHGRVEAQGADRDRTGGDGMRGEVETLRAAVILADRVYVVLAWFAGAIGFALPLSIVGYLIVEGAGRLSWDFLLLPPMGYPLGTAGGIAPAILGSLALVGLGLAVALPLAIASA